jgi:hypothetical protein
MTPLSTKEVPVEPTDEITFKYQVNGRGYQISSEFDVTREQCAAICKAIEGIITDEAAAPTASEKAEPVAWIRFCSDGTYEGPIHDKSREMSEFRKQSGAWTPLFTLSPSAEQALRMAADECAKLAEKFEKGSNEHTVLIGAGVSILSLTNKQDTSAEQGEAVYQRGGVNDSDEFLWEDVPKEIYDRVDGAERRTLYTSPPSADAMFNAWIEAAAAELLRMSRESKVPANQAQWLTAHGMVRTLKRPTDMVVMSREELEALATEVYQAAPSIFELDTEAEVKEALSAIVSRVKEGK